MGAVRAPRADEPWPAAGPAWTVPSPGRPALWRGDRAARGMPGGAAGLGNATL